MSVLFILFGFLTDLGYWQSWYDFFTNRELDWTMAHWLATYDYAAFVVLGIVASLIFVFILTLIFYRRRRRQRRSYAPPK